METSGQKGDGIGVARERYRAAIAALCQSEAYEKIITYLGRYLAPEERRARALKDFIRPALEIIKNFQNDADAADLEIFLIDQVMTTAGVRIWRAQLQGAKSTAPTANEMPIETMHRAMADVRGYQQMLATTSRLLDEMDWEATIANAYRIAELTIKVRHECLRSFAQNSLQLTMADFQAGALQQAKDELAGAAEDYCDKFVEAIKDPEMLKVVGEGTAEFIASFAGPFYAIAKLTTKLLSTTREMKEVYQSRGPLDELLDFVDLIHNTKEINDTQMGLLRAQQQAFLLRSN